MKTFKQFREEFGDDFTSKPNKPNIPKVSKPNKQYKDISNVSKQNKPRRPYKNVGGVKIKYYDFNNDSIIDAKKTIPAHEIVFNKKHK